ncbi:ancylostoma secreted protein-like [Copidosoma floridanum]|uniref:ancylostoma secreted protein-like n=1 Tax=Copidosoma floridanum TaxID=29053 RepID=UPI0006C98F49|nr:ancylostoma secreted protein-like [Copidosoma floridanum]
MFRGSQTNRIIDSGLTNDEKILITSLHNELRQKVANGQETNGYPRGPQPPARYMPVVEWDEELSTVAQKWANQCIWGHDNNRHIKRFKVGQNIASLSTTGNVYDLKVKDMVMSWYDEVKHCSREDITRFRSTSVSGFPIGHYTQMLWAKSTKIGCGAVKYKDGNFNTFYLVCNYGPAGNMISEAVYEILFELNNIMRSLIFFFAVVSYAYASAQYCSLQSCQGKPHTVCEFTYQNKCERPISSGLSQNEKDRIVKLHNQLRQKVACGNEIRGAPGPQPPTATKKMANLVWDNEIAMIAQHWADQCQWGHDKCRNTPKEYVGQNIAYQQTTGDVSSIPVEDMVQAWYDEVQYFDGRTLQGISGKVVGHYTQMVWSGTTKIGCGAVKYKKADYNRFYLVCNYSPGGNIGGVKVYETQKHHDQLQNNQNYQPQQNQYYKPQQNEKYPTQPSYNNYWLHQPQPRPQPQLPQGTSFTYSVNGKPATKEEFEKFKNQYKSSMYTWNGKSVSKEEFENKKRLYQAYLSELQH